MNMHKLENYLKNFCLFNLTIPLRKSDWDVADFYYVQNMVVKI